MDQAKQDNSNGAKYAFFYMLSLVALVFTALSAGMIIFQIINKLIPDVPGFYQGAFSDFQLKYAISQLIIASPIFFFTMRQIHRYLFSGELGQDSPIRKWLTYLMLFVSSLVMIGWLIGTLNNFFQGELSAKFALKAVSAIGISAAVFSFFLYDIKRTEIKGRRDRVISLYFYGALVFILAVFIASLFVVESPQETRKRKLDGLIIDDFNQIDSALNSYYADKGVLPENLESLRSAFGYLRAENLSDQETGQLYGYRVLGEKEYELCSVFRTASTANQPRDFYLDNRWTHEAGEQCLKQTIYGPDKMIPLPEAVR